MVLDAKYSIDSLEVLIYEQISEVCYLILCSFCTVNRCKNAT